jgi:hypothetical protein
VVEIIDGFEAQQERGIPVLLKYYCRRDCGLHAMDRAITDHTAETSKCGVFSLLVIGE